MAKARKIVNGIVVEVDEPSVVRTIENGVVVEKPFTEVKKKEETSSASSLGSLAASAIDEVKPTNIFDPFPQQPATDKPFIAPRSTPQLQSMYTKNEEARQFVIDSRLPYIESRMSFGDIKESELIEAATTPAGKKFVDDAIKIYAPDSFGKPDGIKMLVENSTKINAKNRTALRAEDAKEISTIDAEIAQLKSNIEKQYDEYNKVAQYSEQGDFNNSIYALNINKLQQQVKEKELQKQQIAKSYTGVSDADINAGVENAFTMLGSDVASSTAGFLQKQSKVFYPEKNDKNFSPERIGQTKEDIKKGLEVLKEADPARYNNIMRGLSTGMIAPTDYEYVATLGNRTNNRAYWYEAADNPEYIGKESVNSYLGSTKATIKSTFSAAIGEALYRKYRSVNKGQLIYTPPSEYSDEEIRAVLPDALKIAKDEFGLTADIPAGLVDEISADENRWFYDQIPKFGVFNAFYKGGEKFVRGGINTLSGLSKTDTEKYLESQALQDPSTRGGIKYTTKEGDVVENKVLSRRNNIAETIFEGAGQFLPQILLTRGMGSTAAAAGASTKASQLIGTIGSTYVSVFDDEYKRALETTGDGDKATIIANISAIKSGVIESIQAPEAVLSGVNKLFGKQVVNEISKLNYSNLADLAKKATPVAKRFFTNLVKIPGIEGAEEVLDNLGDYGLYSIAAPKSVEGRNLAEETVDVLKEGVLATIIPALFGATTSSFSRQFTRDSLNLLSRDYDDVLQKAESGRIQLPNKEQTLSILKTHKESMYSVPRVNAVGKNISKEQAKEFAFQNTLFRIAASQEAEATVPAVKNSWAAKKAEAEQRMNDIYEGKVDETVSGIRSSGRTFTDFDGTFYDGGEITELGKNLRRMIDSGENVQVLTAREDTEENRKLISDITGLPADKIHMGLSPSAKAAKLDVGDTFFDNDQKNIDEANKKAGVSVFDVEDLNEMQNGNTLAEQGVKDASLAADEAVAMISGGLVEGLSASEKRGVMLRPVEFLSDIKGMDNAEARAKYGDDIVDLSDNLFGGNMDAYKKREKPVAATQTANVVSNDASADIQNQAIGVFVKSFIPETATKVSARMNNAEYINDNELSGAAQELYDLLDRIEKSESFSPMQKQSAAAMIEPLITQIEGYEFRTKTETRPVTQKVATGRTNKTQRKVTPVLEQAAGSKATVTNTNGVPVTGVLRLNNNNYEVINEEGNKVAAIGDKQRVDVGMRVPANSEGTDYIEFDADGNVKSVTFETADGRTVKVENPEKALDIAISLRMQEIGEVPDGAFNDIYEEVIGEEKVEVPYVIEKPKASEQDKTSSTADEQAEAPETGGTTDGAVQKAEPASTEKFTEEQKERIRTRKKRIQETRSKGKKKQQYEPPKDAKTITISSSTDANDIDSGADQRRRKMIRDAAKAAKFIGRIHKGAKVVLYDSSADFEAATGEQNTAGTWDGANKTVHINMTAVIRANEAMPDQVRLNTVIHEAAHPILNAIYEADAESINDLYRQLVQLSKIVDGAGQAVSFGNRYDTDFDTKMEAIVEFISMVANGDVDISRVNKGVLASIERFFNRLISVFRMGDKDLAPMKVNSKNILKLAKDFTIAFHNGREVAIGQPSGATKTGDSKQAQQKSKLKSEQGSVGVEMAGEKLPTVDEVYDILESEESRQGGSWLDSEYGDARFESEEQARKYAEEVHSFLVGLGNEKEIPVYRAVSAEDVDLSPYGIGESWSFSLDAAKEFGRRLGVPLSKVKIISGKVPSENVDWQQAVRLYHSFSDIHSGDSEFELPVPSNRKIVDVQVRNFKDAKEQSIPQEQSAGENNQQSRLPDSTIKNPSQTLVNIAPFFSIKVNDTKEVSRVLATTHYQQFKDSVASIAKVFGLEVGGVNDGFGGFGGITEVSSEFVITGDFDKVVEFTAIMGALTPEVQEATIASRYTQQGDDYDAERYDISIDNEELAKQALEEAGFSDKKSGFSLFNGDIIIYEYKKGHPAHDSEFSRKFAVLLNKLKQKGVFYGQERVSEVKSEYINATDRRGILEKVKGNAERLQQGGAVFRNILADAWKRNEEFIRERTERDKQGGEHTGDDEKDGVDKGADRKDAGGAVLEENKSADTQNFFTEVEEGKHRPSKQLDFVLPLSKALKKVHQEWRRFKGYFDEHIETNIPVFREVQLRKINAIVNMLPNGGSVIDLGGSTGAFGKTITLLNSKIKSINLDANDKMMERHNTKPVIGSDFVKGAFYEGFGDIEAYKPKKKFDVVHESMLFQFITWERGQFIDEIADNYLKDDGVVILEEKLGSPLFAENEQKKDADFKLKYYSQEYLDRKKEEVLTGMKKNQATTLQLDVQLARRFDHVYQYWDGGNFKGYVASNNKAKIDAFLNEMGDTTTEFSSSEVAKAAQASKLPQTEQAFGLYEDDYNQLVSDFVDSMDMVDSDSDLKNLINLLVDAAADDNKSVRKTPLKKHLKEIFYGEDSPIGIDKDEEQLDAVIKQAFSSGGGYTPTDITGRINGLDYETTGKKTEFSAEKTFAEAGFKKPGRKAVADTTTIDYMVESAYMLADQIDKETNGSFIYELLDALDYESNRNRTANDYEFTKPGAESYKMFIMVNTMFARVTNSPETLGLTPQQAKEISRFLRNASYRMGRDIGQALNTAKIRNTAASVMQRRILEGVLSGNEIETIAALDAAVENMMANGNFTDEELANDYWGDDVGDDFEDGESPIKSWFLGNLIPKSDEKKRKSRISREKARQMEDSSERADVVKVNKKEIIDFLSQINCI